MITIAGEALMDVVTDASGSVTAFPGGAPFNVARTIAQMGGVCQFVGRFSDDDFGRQLRSALEREGVAIPVREATSAPTTLAIAQVDDTGSADYRFYLEGTAAAQLRPGDIPPDLLAGSNALALGGLGILIEPTASTLLGLIRQAPRRSRCCSIRIAAPARSRTPPATTRPLRRCCFGPTSPR
jgi:fructokinase